MAQTDIALAQSLRAPGLVARKLTAVQKRILACHKPNQRHAETAWLAKLKDKFGELDIALVKATLKAESEYQARQSKRR